MQCNGTTGNRADIMSLSCNTLQQNQNHTASLTFSLVMKECNIFWYSLYIFFTCSLSNSFGLTKALNCSTSSDVMLTWQFDKHQHLEIAPCIPTPQILHRQTASKSFLSCQTAHSTKTVLYKLSLSHVFCPCVIWKTSLNTSPKNIPNISHQNFTPGVWKTTTSKAGRVGPGSWALTLWKNRAILEMKNGDVSKKSSWVISKNVKQTSHQPIARVKLTWRQATI